MNTSDPPPKIVIMHQNLTFSPNAVVVTWRALNNESSRRCAYYQLSARHGCDINSDPMVLINNTVQNTIILRPEVLSNFTFFYLTVYDEQDSQCDDVFLEAFQFTPGSKFLSWNHHILYHNMHACTQVLQRTLACITL